MNSIPWFGIAIFLLLIAVLQEIRVIQLGKKIKTLEHYIDIYRNKTESEILEKYKDGNKS